MSTLKNMENKNNKINKIINFQEMQQKKVKIKHFIYNFKIMEIYKF